MADTTSLKPLKGWSRYAPLNPIESSSYEVPNTNPPKVVKSYNWKFITKDGGNIKQWNLKKVSHWICYTSAIMNGGIGGVIPSAATTGILVPSLNMVNFPGQFEYKIKSPDNRTIMWSRVNICINVIAMVMAGITGFGISSAFWMRTQDRTDYYRNRRVPRPSSETGNPIEPPDAPILIPATDGEGVPRGSMEIYHHGLPLSDDFFSNSGKSPVDELKIERADIPDGASSNYTPVWKELDGVMEATDKKSPTEAVIYKFTDTTTKPGETYLYRIVAKKGLLSRRGDGISYTVLSKNTCRSIIETYVIDGRPTVLHPNWQEISGKERIAYEEYAEKNIFYPKAREETFILIPETELNTTTTVDGLIVDFEWYGPFYETDIPNGSTLEVVMDGLSYGTMSQKGKNSTWQFSYKTEEVLWNYISDVSKNMISAQPHEGEVVLVSGKNPASGGSVSSNKALLVFNNTSSAFVYNDRNGKINVIVKDERYNYLYTSLNKGQTFIPLNDETGNPKKLFDSIGNLQVIDIYKDKWGKIHVLIEQGKTLLTANSDNDYSGTLKVIGDKKSDDFYRYEITSSSERGQSDRVSIVSSTHRFISRDNGTNWLEIDDLEE